MGMPLAGRGKFFSIPIGSCCFLLECAAGTSQEVSSPFGNGLPLNLLAHPVAGKGDILARGAVTLFHKKARRKLR
eukprot:1145768-Pelagomonas_calceolata.AAC.4